MLVDLSQMFGKKILITGGLGFIGSNLAKRLVELGAEVTIFARYGKNGENISNFENKVKVIEGNLTNESDVSEAIKDKDYLFHMSWQTDLKKSMQNPKEDLMSDILGIINLLEICKNKNPKIKIIFSSTVTVTGYTEKINSDEYHYESPLSVYEINKLTAEKYLKLYFKSFGLKTCVLRLSNVFGERQRIDNPNRGVLNFMIGRALRGEKLNVYGTGEFIRDYCYVQNYVDAFILAALSEKTNGEVFILGSGEGRTFNEVVEKIKLIVESISDKKVVIEHISFPEGENEINKRNFTANFEKFRNATSWTPKISFDEGLKKTIEFYLKK